MKQLSAKPVNTKAANSKAQGVEDDFLAEMNKEVVVIPSDMTGITDEEAFDLLDQAKPSQLTELTGSYWNPTPGEHKFKFLEMTTYQSDKGPVNAVKIQDRAGLNYVAAQAVLVGALRNVVEQPCFFKVIVGDVKIKGRNGDYYDMKVLVFPSAADKRL